MSASYPPHLHIQQQSSSDDLSVPPGQRPGKRKRLLKACEACHKSKRRCDGQCPCQNCDFAGKQCVYKDSAGRIVPPPNGRVPESAPVLATLPSVQRSSYNSTPQHSSDVPSSRGPDPVGSGVILPPIRSLSNDLHHFHPTRQSHSDSVLSPVDKRAALQPQPRPTQDLSIILRDVGIDPLLCRELVNLFFSHCHPQDTMFHRPTFLNALATAQIPVYLLNSIFALAAPFSLHPSIRKYSTSGDAPVPHWQTGDRFAQRAIAELRSTSPPNECGSISAKNRPGEQLEFSQALCILALHECVMRRPGHIHLKYMSIALETLVELGVPDWDVSEEIPSPSSQARALAYAREMAQGNPADPAHPDPNGTWRRRECHRRTLWVIHWTNMLASAFSLTSPRFKELDVRLYLPMDEGVFDMVIKDEVVPEFLATWTGGPPSRTYISEFGHLLRVTAIYSQIMGFFAERSEASRRRTGSKGEMARSYDTFQMWDAALERWRASLPDRLQLSVENVDMHMASFEFGGGGGPWAFVFMHALAQCSLLGLYAVFKVERNHEAIHKYAKMRQNAHDILLSLINRLGPRGRSSIWLAALLLHIGGHGPPLDEEAVRRYVVDPVTINFLNEYEGNWGVRPTELFSLEFRAQWVHDGLAASQFHPPFSDMSSSRSTGSGTKDEGRQSLRHQQQHQPSDHPSPSSMTVISNSSTAASSSSTSSMPLPLQRQMLSGPSDMDEDHPDTPHKHYVRSRDALTLPPLRNIPMPTGSNPSGSAYGQPSHRVQDPRYGAGHDSAQSSVEPRRRGPAGMPWLAEEEANNINAQMRRAR